MPRVLVIATQHEGAPLVMGTYGAEELLTGTTMFQVKLGDAEATPETITHLHKSNEMDAIENAGVECNRRRRV